MKKYYVFLFDADGTLFDYDMAEANALRVMFDKHGFDYSESVRLQYIKINDEVWKSYYNGEITKNDLQELRFRRLFDKFSVYADAAEFNRSYLYELGK